MITLLGGVVWYLGKTNAAEEKYAVNTANVLTPKTTASGQGGDSDKDGLKDWEEVLWKTNPKSADTDGDGTWDGEEVASGRNPAVRGPDDQIAPDQNTGDVIYQQSQQAEGNLTEQFAEAFATTIGSQIAGSGSVGIKPQDIEGISNYLPSKTSIFASLPQTTRADLVLSERHGAAYVKEYFSGIYTIYEKNLLEFGSGEDLQIIQRALTNDDTEELSKLDAAVRGYEESFKEIRKIPVPFGYENFAIQELTYLAKTGHVIKILRNADKDPLLAMAAMEPRIELFNEFAAFRREVGKLLQAKGVVYASERWGVMFQ